MNAMAPCPPDSPLMQAWERHQATDEYKNSHSWATRYIADDDPAELERVRESGANPWTKVMKVRAVEGSLWAQFSAGWEYAGGIDPFKKPPTLTELQELLDRDDDVEIEVLPNGSIRAKVA